MNTNAYSPQIILGVCVAAFVLLLLIVWLVSQRRSHHRTTALRERFGPEYDVAVQEYGSRRKAEDALEARLRHVQALTLRPLDDTARRRYLAEWDSIQARFVDHPRGAVIEADELISTILTARGYTGSRFDQRVADLSVNHARLVDPYRRANAVVVKAGRNEATTEELRSTMILYRALFEDLLQSKTVMMPRAA
ncbi:hypothetical protein DYQ86_12140 [Acidobacteria bacterium AB60]|nr:hypothetical protein DYQ86_12140 [Acidobacteria bacterium AB60]